MVENNENTVNSDNAETPEKAPRKRPAAKKATEHVSAGACAVPSRASRRCRC